MQLKSMKYQHYLQIKFRVSNTEQSKAAKSFELESKFVEIESTKLY